MSAQAAAEQLPTTRREAVTTCHRYLTGHLDQLHYDTARAAGRPIATGAVEGACRHLIAYRLDITGAHVATTKMTIRTALARGLQSRLRPGVGQSNNHDG